MIAMPRPPAADMPRPEELRMQIAPRTRMLLEEIKIKGGFQSDAEVIRAALALQHHVVQRQAEGARLYLSDADGQIARELLPVKGRPS